MMLPAHNVELADMFDEIAELLSVQDSKYFFAKPNRQPEGIVLAVNSQELV